MVTLCSTTATFGFIENHSSKVLNAKLSLVAVLRWDVVCVEFVLKVQLVQHGCVSTLKTHKDTPKHPFDWFTSKGV